eukprot:jgi/Chrzof1/8607/Cz03g17060.t1
MNWCCDQQRVTGPYKDVLGDMAVQDQADPVFGACCWTKACLSDVKDGVWVLTSLGTDSTPAKWVGTNDKWVAVDKQEGWVGPFGNARHHKQQ